MMRKKAQGEIITSVIIILLILAAIVVVWQVVQTSVSRGGEQSKGQSSCIGINYIITKAVANSSAIVAGNLTIRRNTGAPDVASFKAKVFVDEIDTGKIITIGGELNTTSFNMSNTSGTGSQSMPVGSKIQLASIVGTTQCGFGPEKLIALN